MIEEDSHAALSCWRRLCPANSRTAIRLLASYPGKSLEEIIEGIIEGIATFKIIEQILYRHSSAGKARFAPQAIGMHRHGACEHLRAIAVAVFPEQYFGHCHGYTGITSTIAAMPTLNKLKSGELGPEILERS